jgi:hypothetical protein
MYTYRTEYSLPLNIPHEIAINKDEVAAHEANKTDAETKRWRLLA